MNIREVMTPNPVTVGPQDSLRAAADRMARASCRRLPVVDERGDLVGIITDRDVRLAMNSPLVMRERWQDDMLLEHTQVDACMTPDPYCIGPDAPVQDAIAVMLDRCISGLPVVGEGALVGIVTTTDLLRALVRLLEGDPDDADETDDSPDDPHDEA